MRPASHMPLADRMTLGRGSLLMALESSAVSASCSPWHQMGFWPLFRTSCVSGSKQSVSHCRKTLVASSASGLSR